MNKYGIEYDLITLDCGMKLRYILKKGYNTNYVGIGIKYGSKDYCFNLNGTDYQTKTGIAHFIEHKCFSMPDGTDSFFTLTDLGANANAYTSYDKTVYFFNTVEDIYKPLEILLDTVFTRGFTKENIEHEKSIILSEINMYDSNLDFILDSTTFKNIYLNTSYEHNVIGSSKDVLSTTLEDILINYKAFYNPNNVILTIVCDVDKNELVEVINNHMKKYEFDDNKVVLNTKIVHYEVNEELTIIKGDTLDEKISIGIRLQLENDILEQLIAYDYILDSITSDSSKIYQRLVQDKIINPIFGYDCTINKETGSILLNTSSHNAEKAVSIIIDILNNLKENDFCVEDFNSYIKATLADEIMLLDNVEGLGEVVMDFDYVNIDYFNYLDRLKSISFEDVMKYLKIFTNSKKSKTILIRE